MSTADLAIVALTGLNFAQGGCHYYRDKQLITKLADRVQLPKAPAAPPSVPDKASQGKAAPGDADRPLSILGGESIGEAV